MKSQFGVEAPVGQSRFTIVRAKRKCDTAIVREQRPPPMGGRRVHHAHIEDVSIVIEEIRDLLVLEQILYFVLKAVRVSQEASCWFRARWVGIGI